MTTQIHSGLLHREPPIFELSSEGRTGHALPPAESLDTSDLPAHLLREKAPLLPELSEVEVVRHFVRLSQWNHAIELGMYPLGSCTMKYNPKINDAMAALPGFTAVHPLQEDEQMQGSLELMFQLEAALCRVSGFSAVTLQPSAGANGEFTGLALIRKAIELRGQKERPQDSHLRHGARHQPGFRGAQRLRACLHRHRARGRAAAGSGQAAPQR